MLQTFVVMVYLKILKRCLMTLATTADAMALIQNTKSLPRPKSSDAPSVTTVKKRKTESSTLAPNICIICRTKRCNKKRKTGYEALTTCEIDDKASVLQNLASSCEAVTHEFAGLSISQITAKELKYHRTCY